MVLEQNKENAITLIKKIEGKGYLRYIFLTTGKCSLAKTTLRACDRVTHPWGAQ